MPAPPVIGGAVLFGAELPNMLGTQKTPAAFHRRRTIWSDSPA